MSTQYQRRRFEIHRGPRTKQYWWRLVASNGRELLTSQRFFESKSKARSHIKMIRRSIALAGVVDREA